MARRLPPLNALRSFEASARLGSFVAAAGELRVSAAAVSQQVRRLEQYLDTTLFQRLARGLVLTEAGRDYLPELSAGFDLLGESTARLRAKLQARGFGQIPPPIQIETYGEDHSTWGDQQQLAQGRRADIFLHESTPLLDPRPGHEPAPSTPPATKFRIRLEEAYSRRRAPCLRYLSELQFQALASLRPPKKEPARRRWS